MQSITALPMTVISNLYPIWPFGSALCTYYVFTSWIIQALLGSVHFAVACNRVWAVVWPIHYRQQHTRKVATVINITLELFTLILFLPFNILDIWYRLPEEENGCVANISAQWIYSVLLQIFMNVVCLFPILIFPLLCYKYFKHHCARVATVSHAIQGTHLPHSYVINLYVY